MKNTYYLRGGFVLQMIGLLNHMKKRIWIPPDNVKYPVLAWYQWEGVRKRLDMRTHRYSGEKGTPVVLLTIDVPDDMVLLSEFEKKV